MRTVKIIYFEPCFIKGAFDDDFTEKEIYKVIYDDVFKEKKDLIPVKIIYNFEPKNKLLSEKIFEKIKDKCKKQIEKIMQ